jgi:steroid delta-isomerase-like uncharacterized protein
MLDTYRLYVHPSQPLGKENALTTASTSTPPASVTIGELIPAYSEAWASHDADRIAAFHAEDGIFQLHSGDAGPIEGREAIRDAFAAFLAQFPDLAFEEQEMLVAEWGWSVRWTMRGTLAVPFPVGERTAEPGASIAIDAVDVITASGGLIEAKHTYLDWAAGLEQMGL